MNYLLASKLQAQFLVIDRNRIITLNRNRAEFRSITIKFTFVVNEKKPGVNFTNVLRKAFIPKA